MRDTRQGDTLTTAEAASRLGVTPNSVMAWADAGLLQAWRTPGGHRRISLASVQAMIDERERQAGGMRGRHLQVLLVEDNPDTALILASHLRHILPDSRVRVVRDGFQALVQAGREPPDLLVTDINLPGMNGIAMIRSLRAQAATAPWRFVLVTNYGRHELGPFGEPPDDVPLLTKPVSLDTLRQAVDDVLARASSTP